MTLWRIDMSADKHSRGVAILDNELMLDLFVRSGLTVVAIREILRKRSVRSLEVEILDHDRGSRELPDFFSLPGIYILSKRASILSQKHGCTGSDFYPCHFRQFPKIEQYIYLPKIVHDVFDVNNSQAWGDVSDTPLGALLLFHFKVLSLKCPESSLPNVFAAKMADADRVAGLCAKDAFKYDWQKLNFRGAEFTRVTAVHH